jgi:hypothetical protein
VQAFQGNVSLQEYAPEQLHWDGQAITGSLVLFMVLFVSGFGRVSGFNAWVDAWVLKQHDKRRNQIIDARKSLEEKWVDGSTEEPK